MKPDPEDIWTTSYSESYETANYGSGLAGWVMRTSHALIERPYGADTYFDRVLEVGAGSGIHLEYVRHGYSEYWLTDSSKPMLEQATARAADQRIKASVEDASSLSFSDGSFDRVIACHVLEHLYRPHLVLREWDRVLKPGGVLSIVLPCDPGLAWRLGRHLGPRKQAKRNGLQYDYVMAREHVNPITNLVNFVRYYFDQRDECWWPSRLPLSDANLIYVVNAVK
jgi:phosphatidylethanolamine/phosphatidyl-N-methylethanolamine N-methyltransferase